MALEVGIRQFKNRASAYIDRVAGGEIVTVTKRGKPVAQVIPAGISPGVVKLMTDGRITWSGHKPRLPEPRPLRGTGKTAADYVIEARR